MAEFFLSNIAERLLDKIISLAIEEVRLAFDVGSDLEKLRRTMTSIKAVLLDAEWQQRQNQNEALNLRMWELRDIFYDAEDVLDGFECEARQEEVVKRSGISNMVRRLTSYLPIPAVFSSKMGHKIKEINERLDKLATELDRFKFVKTVDNRRVIHRKTHSFVHSSNVIGRDEDKENIIYLLMKPSEVRKIPVIPIVGIGGLGKTALAQFVYNDRRVTRRFPLRIWVCVSEDFDLTRLLKEIIYSINSEKCHGLSVDALQTRLRNLLNNKKFLLVLDDVWNEDRGKWIELIDLLVSMGNSSQHKIIVTTRTLKVASIMNPTHIYELKGLSHVDCLALFAKWAFDDGEERQNQNLMRIGGEIVKKCKGVPLAVRTLASLLFQERNVHQWISVRDSEIWKLEQTENDIIPVLKLSYYYLPSYLQRCLAYLSLYKKDHMYESNEVVHFWMASGLLEPPKEMEEQEDVGIRYVKELWSRCFIQEVKEYGCYSTFKMHDLIHDLALEVSQRECKIVSHRRASIDEGVRHLSFSEGIDPQSLRNLRKVRTIVGVSGFAPESDFIKFCISNFNYLRALSLNSSSLDALPDSIATLKQLRYLDLHKCPHLRNLPSSFYKLQSLLMLNIGGLKLMQWPDSVQSLSRLRYLRLTFDETNHWGQRIQPECWSSLQYLCLFQCHSEFLFKGVQYLTSLRTLHVCDCSGTSTLPQNLTLLTKLEHLWIEACGQMDLRMEPADQGCHLNLKAFSFSGSAVLKELPRLFREGSASTLQCIRLQSCTAFEQLPEWLQNLTSLQKLEIISCRRLSSLPEGMDGLTALRQLIIQDCPMLTERCQRDGGADWPKIAHVPEVHIED